MRSFTLLLIILPVTVILNGQQPVGTWTDHLSYDRALNVAAGSEKIFASTGNSLLVFNKEFNELGKLSAVNGLSETGISAIAWSEEYRALIVAYKTGNLDLVFNNSIFNIPDIARSQSGELSLNRMHTRGRYAYLATGLGIFVIDLIRKEIHDTWRPAPDTDNNEVFDLTFGDDKVFAATKTGIWYADLSNQGLGYFGNWKQIDAFQGSKCTLAIFSGGLLFVNVARSSQQGDVIYSVNGEARTISETAGITNWSFDPAPDGFIVSSSRSARYYDNDGSLKKTITSYGWGIPDICQTISEGNTLWIADRSSGLIKGEAWTGFAKLTLSGPSSDNVSGIASLNGKTVICAGGTDTRWNAIGRPVQVSVHENGKFNNIIPGSYSDAMRCCIDRDDNSHFFVSSWGAGLFEFRNNSLVKHYDQTNSLLGYDNPSPDIIRICGLTFDGSGNLWVTRSGSKGRLFLLKPDGSWTVYPLAAEAPVMGDIISTSLGQKWVVLPETGEIFVIGDNGTPDLLTDDKSVKMHVIGSDGTYMSATAIAEDLDGNIWVGTDKGPVIYYNTGNIFTNPENAYRIKIPRNDGSGLADYLLGNETVTSISVDGANRKWLGTSGSGAFLVSESDIEVIRSLNKGNSPLFSDSLSAVTVDNKTGEVWFGTSKGLLSLRETATAGGEKFSGVYSFPNPVREDFEGNVTITGLMTGTRVKITDVSGNLVFETTSTGGQASWDLTTYRGKRVVTGVYLVFCASEDGSQSCMTKILVISR